jgi:hypothetical protein
VTGHVDLLVVQFFAGGIGRSPFALSLVEEHVLLVS